MHVETADKPTQTSEELTFSFLPRGGNRYLASKVMEHDLIF